MFPQADEIIQKIKHFLITETGKVLDEATSEEFYFAFCMALRQEIMIYWTAYQHSIEASKKKIAYYLSLEYLPGKLLGSTITNIQSNELVKEVLHKTGRNFREILSCEIDPGLGNGGLGRLSSCILESCASLQYPIFSYGLRYQYGIFDQEIWDGIQVERPDIWLLYDNPWEVRKDLEAIYIHYNGKPYQVQNSHKEIVEELTDYEEVRALPFDIPIVGYPVNEHFSVATLRLWSTKESPRNFELQRYNAGQLGSAAENTSLTDVLYPNDNHDIGKKIRLKQEFLLSSASLKDIIKRHLHIHGSLDDLPEKVSIQINDTHPALVIPEMVRILTKDYDLSFKEALGITSHCCNYTNHTTLKEALEEWNEERVSSLLPRQYHLIQQINQIFLSDIRERYPNDEEKIRRMSIIEQGQIKMANLCLFSCKHVNGVAKLHGEILQTRIFPDFHERFPEKITYITNGVTQRRWLLHANPSLAALITKKIGDGWILDFSQMERLREFAEDEETQEAFLAIKKANKKDLLTFLEIKNPIRGPHGRLQKGYPLLTEDALFDVQVKRIHEYKRHLMNVIHAIILFFEIQENPDNRKIKRFVLLGGKASPGYEMAKAIIRLSYAVARKIDKEEAIKERLSLLFYENYNVSRAQKIIPAADLSQQISTAGMEASGTGNMKLSMNGALTIGTDDGANIEMKQSVGDKWWPFSFGASADELAHLKTNNYNAKEIYSSHPKIKKALDAINDGTFAENEAEHQTFQGIFHSLVEGYYTHYPDPFFILYDLPAYYEVQKKVEKLYQNPNEWAKYAIHNMAGMSRFSIDCSVREYSQRIWEIEHSTTDPAILEKVKKDYAEHLLFHK